MMYYYWREKGIRPSVFYSMPAGEKIVVTAFFEKEMRERVEQQKDLEK